MRPSNRHALVAAALLPLSALVIPIACSSSDSGAPPPPPACSPDLASIEVSIFAPSCAKAGCHGAVQPAAGLDLSAASDVAAKLIGVPAATCDGKIRVVPGDPDSSFLFEKITADKPACGDRMPVGGALTADEKACIKGWIASLPAVDGGPGDGGDAGCETCGEQQCVDLQTNAAHCGACDKACPPGASCAAGACACAGGLTACGAACVDTQSDAKNCGDCGKGCPTGAICSLGACACPGGGTVCGAACADTSSDPMNCGGCGKACAANEVCKLGVCSAGCGALTQCGASCVDTQTSAANCGGCGKACPAGASCASGACQCPVGTSDCGGMCINTATDPANCGGCGKMCAQGTTCQASACACPGGGMVCGAGCVDTQTDANNCGGCGKACAIGQTCTAGVCSCGNASVSFSAAVQPIFTASCASAGCHAGAMPQQGMNLSAGKAYAAIVNVSASECNDGRKRVLPGQPQQSYLLDKVSNVNICSGTQMPKLGQLPVAQIKTISDWICEGAPNN